MSEALRKICKADIIDYTLLLSHLSGYKAPHRKITGLLQSGVLIRVKKGLYVFGEDYRRQPIPLGVLANLIYGPSYLSLAYALSYYGLIPERVESVTSMTCKRYKVFQTPIGNFTYRYINLKRFTVGVNRQKIDNEQYILLASPEKAICDFMACEPRIKNQSEMRMHLIENIRIDETLFYDLDQGRLNSIAQIYRQPNVFLLNDIVQAGL